MASEINLNAVFSDIANSIRSKKGTTGTIQPINMASEIDSIEAGGSSEKSVIYKGLEAKGTNWYYAFYGTNNNIFIFMTEISESDIPPSNNVTIMASMFRNCYKLTTIPQLDTSNVTSMSYMFYDCRSLTTIPQLDTSNVTNTSGMFKSCESLKYIYMKNIKVGFNISDTALKHDALVELINNGLSTITTTQTLTMGSSKLALLSDSEKQVALDRGWTLA